MSAEELLVLFRSTRWGVVQAYFADIPAEGIYWNLKIRGPIDFAARGDYRHPGNPIYDYNRDQILWASIIGQGPTTELWRFDPHFSHVSTQEVPIKIENFALPCIVLDGKTVTLCGGGGREVGRDWANVVMSRRGQDSKWTDLNFKSPGYNSIGTNSDMKGTVIYKPSVNAPLKYIYAFRYDGYLGLDIIRESSFNELSRDDSIQWQHFKLTSVGYSWEEDVWAPIITHDKVTRKNRLYIFTYVRTHGFFYTYFPLRQDGSIDSYDQSIKGQNPQHLPSKEMPNPKRLKVHEAGGRLILLLETGDKKEPLLSYTGFIQDDGLAPQGKDWVQVAISFDNLDTATDVQTTYSSVITPSSYR
ncbi:hypothetical protein F53441_900 [Fusarium austroafricanum]|uniref:Uncharacterized protein n=1 Tax=Fusarium austroafricanum TaxID=2364996 RepID=A0A8H4PE03_9HYPO|nr:hypothetical protein F53441_900 [Fusarium austroafricanum]